MAERFEQSVEEMRARRGVKWKRFPSDVLPAWVADMDFAVPDAVQEVVEAVVSRRDYGYGNGHGVREGKDGLAQAFVDYAAESWDWGSHQLNPDGVLPVTDLIQGMYSPVYAFTQPGDGIVVQTPIYPPFLDTIASTGRRMVENRLVDDGTKLALDVDGLRASIDANTRMLMVPNPHNPTGRVFTRTELEAMAEVALRHDLIVVSDEIHSDLVYSGHTHIPFAALGPEVAARTITLTSATKGYNIPGLRCALMYFGSLELKARFHQTMPARLLGAPNVIGLDATIAAWRHGKPWLRAVLAVLEANRDRLTAFMQRELPQIGYRQPEGTYLAWLDCRSLNLGTSPFQFFLDNARVGLMEGANFGEAGVGHVRLNFGTSPTILEEILNRLAQSVRQGVPVPA